MCNVSDIIFFPRNRECVPDGDRSVAGLFELVVADSHHVIA